MKKVEPLRLDVVKQLVPKNYKRKIDQPFIDELNKLVDDPDYGEQFKEDFFTYANSLASGANWSIGKYVEALKFYSLMQAGSTQTDAYCRIRPHRLASVIDLGGVQSDMWGEASRYNSSQLMVKIRTQALVPLHILNQHNVQLAINTLAGICINGKSDIARGNAAATLIKELRPSETSKIELDIGINSKDAIADLRKATEDLAMEQLASIKAGAALKSIAESVIVEAEVEEVDQWNL